MIDYRVLGVTVRDQVLEVFGRLSCINAVAAMADVAEEFGGHVSPLSVRAFIFNPTDTERRFGGLESQAQADAVNAAAL